jgi:(E)-4-hydroxy-3-methylbut-2-enyl-diphosphate synthase
MNKTKKVKIRNVTIGGGNPVAVQAMTKTFTSDVQKTLAQIRQLETSGAKIIRLAIPDKEALAGFEKIRQKTKSPLVADIHFDWRLALAAIGAGADKLRINPGNIGDPEKVRRIIEAARAAKIPLRIGLNSGSIPANFQPAKHRRAASLTQAALFYIKMFENFNFYDLVVSVKSTDVCETVAAYRQLSKKCPYPLHLGITEAGPGTAGIIKSSVGLGILLHEGIGDTIRVSLTDDPVKEVEVGYQILKSLGLYKKGIEIISCPTCGRCQIDVVKIAGHLETVSRGIIRPLKIAVMGCVVNGPGEAREADLGIAGGKGEGLIFKKGKIIKKVKEKDIIKNLLSLIKD